MSNETATPANPSNHRNAVGLVIFSLDEQRYALPLAAVERVVPVAEITPLSRASASIAGVINVHGRVLPVIDCHKRFGLPPRAVELSDQFLIAHVERRALALWVDRVVGVHACDADEIIPAVEILPGMDAQGALKLPDGDIVLIHDLDHWLSPEEEQQLELALKTH